MDKVTQKEMNTTKVFRSCPSCGCRVNFGKKLTNFFIWNDWQCECCGATIGFCRKRWLIIFSLITVVAYFIIRRMVPFVPFVAVYVLISLVALVFQPVVQKGVDADSPDVGIKS